MIHLYISQVIDSKTDSKILGNILENDMISLSGGESHVDLLGSDLSFNSREVIHTMKPFSILDDLVASPPTHNFTNTTTSTTSFTIFHPLSFMITTAADSTPATNYSNTQQNTTPTHTTITTKTKKSPTTHILRTLWNEATTTTLSTSTTPPLHTSCTTQLLQHPTTYITNITKLIP